MTTNYHSTNVHLAHTNHSNMYQQQQVPSSPCEQPLPLTPSYQSPSHVPSSPCEPLPLTPSYQSPSVPTSPRDPIDNNNSHMSKSPGAVGHHNVGMLMPPPPGRRRLHNHNNQGFKGNNTNTIGYQQSGYNNSQSQNIFQYPDPPNYSTVRQNNYQRQINDPNHSPHVMDNGQKFQYQQMRQPMNDPNMSPHTPVSQDSQTFQFPNRAMNDPNMSPHTPVNSDGQVFQYPSRPMADPGPSPHTQNDGNMFQYPPLRQHAMNDPNASPHHTTVNKSFQLQIQQQMNDPNMSPHPMNDPNISPHPQAQMSPHPNQISPHPNQISPHPNQMSPHPNQMSPHLNMSPHPNLKREVTRFQFPVRTQTNHLQPNQVMNDPNELPHIMKQDIFRQPVSQAMSMNDPNTSPHPMNLVINSTPFNKTLLNNQEPKSPFDRPDIPATIPEEKIPLSVGYQDGSQPSPVTVAASMSNQVLRYQAAGNAGDQMLSQINYNENDLLPDSNFDNNLNSINSNDLIGGNMSTSNNMPMADNAPPTFDLFDGEGNVNEQYNMDTSQDLQLSGDSFNDSPAAFGMGDSNPMTTTAMETHDNPGPGGNPGHHNAGHNPGGGHHNPGPPPPQHNPGSHNPDPKPPNPPTSLGPIPPPKPRGKGRPSKSGGSPGRMGVQCQVCGKAFNNSSALAKHKLTHSDERKYVCPICSKAFKRQDHLNGHMMTHRSKKPYECKFEGCDKSYCDARSLRRHLENHHQAPDLITTSTVTAVTVVPPAGGPFGGDSSSGSQYPESGGSSGGQGNYFQFDQPQFPGSEQQGGSSWHNQQRIGQFRSGDRSPGYLQQISPISPAPGQPPLNQGQGHTQGWAAGYPYLNEPKPVECTMCHRRFKNIPALNGHMRLHGGYFKKDNIVKEPESKKEPEKEGSQPPTLTPQKELSTSALRAHLEQSAINSQHLQQRQQELQQRQEQQSQEQHRQEQQREQQASHLQQHEQFSNVMGPPKLEPAVSHQGLSQSSIQPSSFLLTSNLGFNQLPGRTMEQQKVPPLMPQSTGPHTIPTSVNYRESMANSKALLESALMQHLLNTQPERGVEHRGLEQRMEHPRYPPPGVKLEAPPGLNIKQDKPTPPIASAFTFTHEDSIKTKEKLLQNRKGPEEFRPIHQPHEVISPSERKRHASADPDKFTSPTRKTSLASPGSLAVLMQNPLARTGSTVRHELERICHEQSDDPFARPEPIRSRSRPDEYNFNRPRSRTDDPWNLYRTRGTEADIMFKNPTLPTSPFKRKKHRPDPLIIPANVNTFGFNSRLRSPRLWDGGHGERSHRGNTPPPYTPPPMLSPVRSGSGLFWTIQPHRPITPKSAPLTPKLSLSRRASLSHSFSGAVNLSHSQHSVSEAIAEEVEPPEEEEVTQEMYEEEPPPETDIEPHVNVGPKYQAEIPAFVGDVKGVEEVEQVIKEDILWCPSAMTDTNEEDVQNFQEFASCAAIPGNGINMEYALHVLYQVKGDIQKAVLELMKRSPKLPKKHPLTTYTYQESDTWTQDEIDSYHQAMAKFDKDFFNIAKEVKTKTTKQCIQFYYLWKKVCPDEYKQLRLIRRRREKDELYNLRSKNNNVPPPPPEEEPEGNQSDDDDDDNESNTTRSEEHNEKDSDSLEKEVVPPPVLYNCDYPSCNATFPSRQALNGHIRIHNNAEALKRIQDPPKTKPGGRSTPTTGPPSNKSATSEGQEEFPCKLCGKVFYKVKSRSAHMKSHRVIDPEKERAKKQAKLEAQQRERERLREQEEREQNSYSPYSGSDY